MYIYLRITTDLESCKILLLQLLTREHLYPSQLTFNNHNGIVCFAYFYRHFK